jgi:hypothetical protein
MQTQHTNHQLRSFGLIVGGVFLVIGAWPYFWRAQPPRSWALVLSGLLILPGLAWPAVLHKPYGLWMGLAHVLGWINTKIILTLMFYTVFTPAAFIMRLIGKDPMNRGFDAAATTYRVLRQPRAGSHMKNQF